MKNWLIIPILALSVFLGGVFYLSAAETRSLGKNDNGKEIQVKLGDILELALEAQGGTGYTWEFDRFDVTHLELMQSVTKSLAEDSRVGGPVLQVWQIRARKEGGTQLNLDYFRPWEGRAKAEKHYRVTINVQ